jgi:hypothetical protein
MGLGLDLLVWCVGLGAKAEIRTLIFYTETTLVTMLTYNILEASYAIKYPRAPLPPFVSPAKPTPSVPSTPHQPFKLLSPKVRDYSEFPFGSDLFYTYHLRRVHKCKNHLPFRQNVRQEHYLPLLQHTTSRPMHHPLPIHLLECLITALFRHLRQPIPKPLRYQIFFRHRAQSSPPTEGSTVLLMWDVRSFSGYLTFLDVADHFPSVRCFGWFIFITNSARGRR